MASLFPSLIRPSEFNNVPSMSKAISIARSLVSFWDLALKSPSLSLTSAASPY
jgi:hypothetical protein